MRLQSMRLQLNLNLSDRAETIASAWYQALADTCDIPQPAEHVRQELLSLTRQIIACATAPLSDEQFQADEARAIGARLTLLGFKRVDVLLIAQPILFQQLTLGLEPSQVDAVQTCLGRLLIELATGFLEQNHQVSLLEKGQTLQAYETEWKNYLADRQEMEQKSQAILRALPDTLGIITLDGVILYFHGGAEQRFQHEEELPFKNIRTYLPSQIAEELLVIYQIVIETGQARTHEYSVTLQNGERHHYQDNITPYLWNSVLVISRDVTKQKRIEEELRTSEARYRSVVETQNEIIGRFTPDGTITFVNEAANRLFGIGRGNHDSARDMLGRNILDFVPPGDMDSAKEALASTFLLTPQNNSITRELKVTGLGGKPIQIEVVTKAIFDDQRKAVEYQTTGRDVTVLRQTEAALRESEARYRSVIEGQTELIVRYLPDTTITFANDALCRYFSLSRQELLGRSALGFVYEEDQSDAAKGLTELASRPPKETIQSGETRVKLNNGEIRWIQWTTRIIYNTERQVTEYQSVGRDITDLKQAQETLEQQNELLRQLGDQLIDVQEIERQRIARDLHDSVLNELGAMLIAPPEMLTPKTVRDNYERLIEQLRQTINGLRSPMLNYGLHAALEDLYDRLMDTPQSESVLTMEIPPNQARFDTNVELHLFRIIQQACENALQHAQAHHIRICGQIDESQVDITVKDDGIGFLLDSETDLANVLAQKHFGLVSMYERSKLIGADVKLSTLPGAGTQVRVLWERR